MTAGRELDALVAEHVFGLKIAATDWPCGHCPSDGSYEATISQLDSDVHEWHKDRGPVYFLHDDEPRIAEPVKFYSTDIAAAWSVIEHLTVPIDGAKPGDFWLDGLGFDCCQDGKPDTDLVHGRWRCHFTTEDDKGERIDSFVTADSAPLAICLAALKAKGISI